jgi:hypothetical protein
MSDMKASGDYFSHGQPVGRVQEGPGVAPNAESLKKWLLECVVEQAEG